MTSTTETTTTKRNGFATIDAFFEGSDIGNKSNDDKKPVITSKITAGNTNLRRGVGVISSSSDGNSFVPNSNIQQQGKRILQVGRKRQHDDDDEDEGGDHNDKDVGNGDDDDEEEDLGRTAIVKSRDVKDILNPTLLVLQQVTATRKKKVGKKERQRLKEQETKNDVPADNVLVANKDSATADNTTITEHEQQEQDIDGDADNVTTDVKKQKRKRKKIRSKQKNIRKDHRDVKPSHIRSRPITAETRMKLQSPKIIKP